MDLPVLLSLIGIILVNGFALISQWIRVKTDIASINVRLSDLDERVREQEQHNNKIIEKLDEKLGKFVENNDLQHNMISGKVDCIKDMVNDLKVELAKK